ncbi:GNAT family N-acetyltransferase [Massilia sp. YIM B02769]|uniref:GNAT family N-acetyltransferase n=1 Tax=Massilia sp. YIM B02769 TaxID=3050129 RepID=UPI0025B6DCC2|nr:GNAT family N-acetyltransferase [Massilia sp. YIM B02769]MDN4056902.1 GNAT family N-acetyltransferase [Massilia sp. YIM B02769]
MHAELRLRASETDDEAFLRRVYAGTRTHEIALAGWDAAGADAFLRMQFDAQQRHYRAYYPQVRFDIVERAGEAIGRLYVARHADAIHVLDIALLAPWRGQGIGAALLRALQEEAAREGHRLTLQVALNNRAHALYARLGFTNTALQGLHQAMEWRAPSTA